MLIYCLGLAVWLAAAPAPTWGPRLEETMVTTSSGPTAARRKPYDRGNCFQAQGCRGDSIGAMWIQAPDFCKAMGGKSWLDQNGRCHDLPAGLLTDQRPGREKAEQRDP
ncbi:MAG: hypothetical protein LBS31_07615, partial [Candidatus Adiutrix sp.]|nr:hypothetical protein [Candidatus Adiutrix sp.]